MKAHRGCRSIDIISKAAERKMIFESAKLFELMEIENYMIDMEE